LGIPFKGGTDSEADPAKNTIDIRIDLLSFMLCHEIFRLDGSGFSMQIGFQASVVVEESGHIHHQIANNREEGERLDEDGFLQESFNRSPAGQDDVAIHAHGTGAANSPSTRIAKRKAAILLILNPKQRLQEVHSFPGFHLKGFDPSGRIFLLVEALNFQN
jgi:hypothetical protein